MDSPFEPPHAIPELDFLDLRCRIELLDTSFAPAPVSPPVSAPHPRIPPFSHLHVRNDPLEGYAITPSASSCTVSGQLAGQPATLVLDSGCNRTALNEAKAVEFGLVVEKSGAGRTVKTAGGPASLVGFADIAVGIGAHVGTVRAAILDTPGMPVLLGTDWLVPMGVVLDFGQGEARIGRSAFAMGVEEGRAKSDATPTASPAPLRPPRISHPAVRLKAGITLPPLSSVEVRLSFSTNTGDFALFNKPIALPISLSEAIVSLPDDSDSFFTLHNHSHETIKLVRNTQLGTLVPTSRASIRPLPLSAFSVTDEQLDAISFGADLGVAERSDITRFVREFAGSFAKDDTERGRADGVKHDFETEGRVPVARPYRVPPWKKEVIEEKVKEMLDQGVVEPSTSSYASPVVLAKKKDGSWRFCVDYRALNKVTKRDQYPLPRIDDVLDSLDGASYFSTLDLAWGYWQVVMTERARERAAFITSSGLYQPTVMPFGLTNAPATFQRLMNSVLRDLSSFCLVYLDDIIIFSKSWSEHLEHLRIVFRRLDEANLRAKLKKCCFGATELPFLGHIVSRSGIRPDPSKIERILAIQRPRSLTEIRAFLGLVGYYRRFIHNFARIASPLTNLLKLETAWRPGDWPPSCQSAFETLRSALTSDSILRYPDFSRPFVLQTDASAKALGAVLSQVFEDGEHPVAFASKALSASEGKRIPAELECMAVVWALRHFRIYLSGSPFVLQTDHQALVYLDTNKDESSLLHRWALKIQAFDFKVAYRKGSRNGNADGLSRLRFSEDGALWTEDLDAPVAFTPSVGVARVDMEVLFYTSLDLFL